MPCLRRNSLLHFTSIPLLLFFCTFFLIRYTSGQFYGYLGASRSDHLIEQSAGQDDGGQHEPAFSGKHSLAENRQANGYTCLGNQGQAKVAADLR